MLSRILVMVLGIGMTFGVIPESRASLVYSFRGETVQVILPGSLGTLSLPSLSGSGIIPGVEFSYFSTLTGTTYTHNDANANIIWSIDENGEFLDLIFGSTVVNAGGPSINRSLFASRDSFFEVDFAGPGLAVPEGTRLGTRNSLSHNITLVDDGGLLPTLFPPTTVPAPGAFVLLGSGMMALLLRKRKSNMRTGSSPRLSDC